MNRLSDVNVRLRRETACDFAAAEVKLHVLIKAASFPHCWNQFIVNSGRTLMIVEHDMGVVFELADRISVLVYGKIIATGTPEEIRNDPRVKEAYLGEEAA